jgi:microcystin-dependent protein
VSEPFVAEIRPFPFNFVPRGWALCDGQLLPISQNTALFSLLGTTYGGDGKTTFALPDLRGRAPLHQGQGPGLSLYDVGQEGGEETVTLTSAEMPLHTHQLKAATQDPADSQFVTASATFASSTGGKFYRTASDGSALSQQALTTAGASLPHNNMQPYLTLNFCIALQGIFPPRE